MLGFEKSGFLLCLGITVLVSSFVLYYMRSRFAIMERRLQGMYEIVQAVCAEIAQQNEMKQMYMAQQQQQQQSVAPPAFAEHLPTHMENISPDSNLHLIHVSDDEVDDSDSDETSYDCSSESSSEVNNFTTNTSPLKSVHDIRIGGAIHGTVTEGMTVIGNPMHVSSDVKLIDVEFMNQPANHASVEVMDEVNLHTSQLWNSEDAQKLHEGMEQKNENQETLLNVESLLEFDSVTTNDPNANLVGNIVDGHLEKKTVQVVDYKKMTVKELREHVVDKGLISNAQKMKKNDILELLENN